MSSAAESCRRCDGRGVIDTTKNTFDVCSACHGSGRVPVPMRGVTDPDESDALRAKLADVERQRDLLEQRVRDGNDWRQALERKLRIATEALERIRTMVDDPNKKASSRALCARMLASDALKELKR